MKKSTRNLLIILIILLVIVCLFSFNVNGIRSLFGRNGIPRFSSFSLQSNDGMVEEAAYDYAAAPMTTNASAKMAGYANGASMVTEAGAITKSEDGERKLVKNVTMSCETQDFDRIYKKVEIMVEGYDGVIDNQSLNNGRVGAKDQRRSCYFTIRVPMEKLDDFVTEITKETNVTYKYESVEDITDNYNDTVARYETLKEEEKKLNALIAKASKVEDMVSIEERLSNVRYQMQSIEKRVANMDKTVDYSTINLDIIEVAVLTESKDATPTKDNIMAAFYKNLEDCKIFLKNAGIYIFTHLPAIALGIIIFIVLLIILIIICAVSDHTGGNKKEKIEKKKEDEKVKDEKSKDEKIKNEKAKEEKVKEKKVDKKNDKEEKIVEKKEEEQKKENTEDIKETETNEATEEVIEEKVEEKIEKVEDTNVETADDNSDNNDEKSDYTMTDLDFTL